ncbi:hypothetical protein DDI74_14245 [Chryseobacterium gleum]|uniref:hypothetical protein n=1 Tax=Chryseobacterium TaxID=59732 RepID=UPI001039ED77|nr:MULTISPECIES: hypothetical protein [Chryseobacterium]MDR6488074.1 hypothetical protein [Chryseobacterium vietnamense]QBJ87353.1 hypothetical protein DDI74_14245 [Chryseobacterium gleum]
MNTTFVNQLIKQKKDLEEELELINALLKKSNIALNEKNETVLNLEPSFNDFPVNENFLKQTLYIINHEKRFLRKSEIAELLIGYHQNLTLDEVKKKISGALTRGKGEVPNLITFQFSSAKKDCVWGRSEWLDENQIPKKEFMYVMDDKRELAFW